MPSPYTCLGLHSLHSLFHQLALYLPGDTTLNELRVNNAIARCHLLGDSSSCTVSRLASSLHMPRPTVSRICASLVDLGVVEAVPCSIDGRKTTYHYTLPALDMTEDFMHQLMHGAAGRWAEHFGVREVEKINQLQKPRPSRLRPSSGAGASQRKPLSLPLRSRPR